MAGFFVSALALFATLGAAAQRANPALGLAWSELFALALPAAIAAAGANLRTLPALGLARAPPKALWLSLSIGAVGFAGAGALMALVSTLLPERWLITFDVTRLFGQGSSAERLALLGVAVLLAPVCEEVVFRGWLLSALRARLRDAWAVALAGLLFACMHLDPVRFAALWALGTLFAWLALRAGSVWPAVLAHAVNNGLGLALAAAASRAGGAPRSRAAALAVAPASASMLALAALALWGLAALYRRATPAPPLLSQRLVPRDAAAPAGEFRPALVPRAHRAAAALGLALLAILYATRR